MKRDAIDFFEVRPAHRAVHESLLNWARWARGGRGGSAMLPMFQHYRPDGYHELTVAIPVDSLAATKLQKLMIVLPEKHRWAIQWHYVKPWIHPLKVCRVLAVSRDALAELVHDGRSMLRNRSAE